MRTPHEPHDDFVERLQWQIRAEARRRSRIAEQPQPSARPRWQVALAAIALAVVSMGVGGAAVIAAAHVQTNQQRDLLSTRYESRLELEQARLVLARQKVDESTRRVQIGVADPEEAEEQRRKLAELESAIRVIELQIQEVRISGKEPVDAITAPLVGGRDFVSERWRVEMESLRVGIASERLRVREVTRRVDVGLVSRDAIADAQQRVDELESALAGFEARLGLRQRFIKKEVGPAEAELRIVEMQTQLRQQALRSQLESARRSAARVTQLFEKGLSSRVQLAEAQLKVREIEADLAKADVDLALVQYRIAKEQKVK